MTLTAARFQIDGLIGSFHGFTDGSDWNGFACPRFTREQMEAIWRAYAPLPDYKATVEGDVFSLYMADSDQTETFSPDASGHYTMEGFCWTQVEFANIVLHVECPKCLFGLNELREVIKGGSCESCGEPLTIETDALRSAQGDLLIALGED